MSENAQESRNSKEATSHDRKHPCVPCQKRKVKCDRNEPCLNCIKTGKECVSPSTLPPRRRKKRFPEAELLARLKRYEEHLRRYGADIDAINNETSLPIHEGSTDASSNVTLHADDPTRNYSIVKSLRGVENNVWNGVNPEFRYAEELLRGSSDDEESGPITKSYDSMLGEQPDFPFMTPTLESLTELHPSTVDIFRLWQVFLDRVNPVTKVLHAPTTQQTVLDASGDLRNVSKTTEALMFCIYSISVASLSTEDCQTMFGEAKSALLSKYQTASRHALLRAGLLRSSDLTTLQAYVFYLMSSFNFSIDPRSLYCLLGIAVRICQRMGLNFDGETYGLLPFEVEMRRRLWWAIVLLDFRVSELSGAGSSALNHSWTTKIPLNVNDSDLVPDMKDPPAAYTGVTEMMYVIMRYEMTNYQQNLRNCSLPLAEKDKAIDELDERLESQYSKYADPSVPLHLISILMKRGLISKLKMGPRHPHLTSFTTVQPLESNKLFDLSLTMIECYNLMTGSPKLQRFLWLLLSNFPLPGFIFLLCVLRTRPEDSTTDRAWVSIEEGWSARENMKDNMAFWKRSYSALALGFANLMVKAWEPRQRSRPDLRTPPFILEMMEMIRTKKSGASSQTQSPASFPQVPHPKSLFKGHGPETTKEMNDPMVGADDNMDWAIWATDMIQMPLDFSEMLGGTETTTYGF